MTGLFKKGNGMRWICYRDFHTYIIWTNDEATSNDKEVLIFIFMKISWVDLLISLKKTLILINLICLRFVIDG